MRKCKDCLYHHLSMDFENDPDHYPIASHICSLCGSDHRFFAEDVIHPQIVKLATVFTEHLPTEIKEGGAVDNAIRLLSKVMLTEGGGGSSG